MKPANLQTLKPVFTRADDMELKATLKKIQFRLFKIPDYDRAKNYIAEALAYIRGGNAPDTTSQTGAMTALHFASYVGDTESVLELTNDLNANVNARNNDGNTPLDMANIANQSAAANILIRHGGKIGEESEKTHKPKAEPLTILR